MAKTETGSRRVRADLPDRWRAGDKTGTAMIEGMGSAYVDIGFVVPDGRGPLTFATYYMVDAVHDDMDPQAEALLAEVGRTIAAVFAR
jgi:beta-lactamase class A